MTQTIESRDSVAGKEADRLRKAPARTSRFLRRLVTGIVILLAVFLLWAMWEDYMGTPWTRDGTVRAYVITETPEVSGRIVTLPIVADQYVPKGDLLMEIDPTDYRIAVSNAEAVVANAKASLENRKAEAERRLRLNSLAVTVEEQQTFVTQAQMAEATYNQALASLHQAQVNLGRTRLISPVNGHITNLLVQVGDYATAGQKALAIVNTDSFWVDGYFEETLLERVHVGDPARVKLMGYNDVLKGHVVSIASGISVPNAQPDSSGLASVNPVFTWIRLAQRIPVRVVLDEVPPSVTLAVGLTATVEIIPTTATDRLKLPYFLKNISGFLRR
jgi:multidrug resistance efflux pump